MHKSIKGGISSFGIGIKAVLDEVFSLFRDMFPLVFMELIFAFFDQFNQIVNTEIRLE